MALNLHEIHYILHSKKKTQSFFDMGPITIEGEDAKYMSERVDDIVYS